jgi:CO/xanthine dehydrogenase FAD-binding subunit
LIDLYRLPLRYVEERGGRISIGATATLTDLLEHQALMSYGAGILPETLGRLGSPALRNAATVGGHLVRARLSDLVPVFLVFDAEVSLTDGTERSASLDDFYRSRAHMDRMILTEVSLPARWADCRAAFVRFARAAFDFPILNCAVAIRLDGGVIVEARFAVGETPALGARVDPVESLLIGTPLGEKEIERVARAAQNVVEVGGDSRASAGYRHQLVYVGTRRALSAAAGRPEPEP